MSKFIPAVCCTNIFPTKGRRKSCRLWKKTFFEKNQIAEVYGHIEVIDTANQMVDTKGGESICYDKLLISTGADSFIPPVGDLRKAKKCIWTPAFERRAGDR